VYLPEKVQANKMAPKSELMTYLRYEPGTKGMKFMRSSNTIFMASTITFDESLFPCCPTAIMPPGTAMDDESPHDQEGPHGTPRDDNDNHPSNSDDQNHFQGPPSFDPKSPSESLKDELRNDDIYGSDVTSEHSVQDTAAHDPPSLTPPVLS